MKGVGNGAVTCSRDEGRFVQPDRDRYVPARGAVAALGVEVPTRRDDILAGAFDICDGHAVPTGELLHHRRGRVLPGVEGQGSSRLDADGVAHPAIIGTRLLGSSGSALLRDTDAGSFDRDRRFDRAVGPMQIAPSAWSIVSVDADLDSKRDPKI